MAAAGAAHLVGHDAICCVCRQCWLFEEMAAEYGNRMERAAAAAGYHAARAADPTLFSHHTFRRAATCVSGAPVERVAGRRKV
jgi:hypothetical protein